MKSRFSTRLATALSAVVVVSLMARQKQALSMLDVENHRLRTRAAEAKMLTADNQKIPELSAMAAQASQLRTETSDLHKLRSEVHQLRDAQKELRQTRADNKRLHQLQTSGSRLGEQAPETLPFLMPADLSDKGLATPEAAIHTILWALREGNLERMKGSLESSRKVDERFITQAVTVCPTLWAYPSQSPDERSRELKKLFEDLRGLRVIDRRSISPEEIQLTLQIATGGDNAGIHDVKVRARLFGSEWRLSHNSASI